MNNVFRNLREFVLFLWTVLILSGCIVFPADKGISEVTHTGLPNGRPLNDSVPTDQLVVEERHYSTTDIKYLFSPEGPVRKSLGPATATSHYYLQAGQQKIRLAALDAYTTDERWDQFFSLGKAWYAMNYHARNRYLKLAVFSQYSAPTTSEIFLDSGNATIKLYLATDNKSLIWHTVESGAYRYTPGSDRKPVSLPEASYTEQLKHAAMLVEITGLYEDTDFASEKNEIIKADPYDATGIKQRLNAAEHTTSLKHIIDYSKHPYYIVRWAVAENSATPDNILSALATDESEYVARAARKRLKSRGISLQSSDDGYY